MTEPRKPSKKRQVLETGLILGGALMIGVFFVFKGWSANQSHAGLSAFEEVRASTLPLAAVEETLPGTEPEPAASLYTGTPDTSVWSEKRIHEYNTALAAASDAPHAVLNIDHLNIQVPVYNGADDFNLNRGVARILGTARIGEEGNLGIAGHRDGFFRPLKDIQLGDTFDLRTYYGNQEYRVVSIDIVEPEDLHVLAPTDAPSVTLVTCYPFYYVGNAPQRFIVRAEVLDHKVSS